ncbi:sensor histidine kinase [Psychrobacillus vulpis]|nr:ATP-binding protein [Psychrobacillus vulpis]
MKFLDKKIMIPIVIVILFTFYASYISVQSPIVALSVIEDEGHLVVDEILDNGWAYHQEISSGDILLKVNGLDPFENRQVMGEHLIRNAKSLVFLDADGNRKEFEVSYESEIQQLFSHVIFPFAYMLLTVYVAIYIYRKQKTDASAFILIQFLLCIALAYGSAAASSRGDVLARLVNALTFAGCLLLYIRFLNVFLKRFNFTFIKQKNLWKLYSLLLIILIEYAVTLIVPNQKLSMIELGIFTFLLIFIIVLLIKNYSKNKDKPGNQAIKMLGFIFIIALSPFTLLYAIPTILLQHYLMNAEIAVMFLLLIPISFIYLQLAERLFDIDYMIGRLKYYTLLAFPFSLILSVIFGLSFDNDFSNIQLGFIFIMLFVGSIIFLYAKEWIDYKNRKYMFSSRGDLQTNLYTFFHKTRGENKVQDVINRILKELEDTLMVKKAIFLEMMQIESTKKWTIGKATSEIFIDPNEIKKILWEYQDNGSITYFSRGFGIVVGSEVGVKQIILCDEKKNGTNLNIEEKIWIEMMAYFSSVVVENMKLIEGLVDQISKLKVQETSQHPIWLSKLLFAISEKERANLSNDLHDSILQEQLQLLRETDSISEMASDTLIIDKLGELKEQILDNVHLIRETCMELRPPLLSERGLLESLHQLIRQTKLRCNFLLYVSLENKIHMNKEYELIFYRVFQELLNNAMKHSNATEVHLSLSSINELFVLQYEDNGVGFDINSEGYSFTSMGLLGIKERIRSIGGNMDIVSKIGQGVKVTIEVKGEEEQND